jgi:TolB-like protein/Tfp pilus assembly protein PilF
MTDNPDNPLNFWEELKRRKVFRVITVYAAASFVILELVSIIAEPFGLPDWTLKLVFTILCVGLIISIILSWIYDITPEGIKKTKTVHQTREEIPEKPSALLAWKIATYSSIIIIVVLVSLQFFKKGAKTEFTLELEKSIAVLPFENMSDDSGFAHLGDAITDEIIMQLYKINEFEVRSRTSIMQYKDTDKGSPVIGKELNVNYLLEGSAQRYEDQVRIRVQLIHALTDDHIWGDVFEGAWKDIFTIQINLAKQVAHELKTVLSPEEIGRIENEPTDNIEAYNLYLQGRYIWNQGGRERKEYLDQSIEFYKRALEIDPGFALAYTGLAASYTSYSFEGYAARLDVMPRAKMAAMKALELNNTLGEAYAELAFVQLLHDGDWTGSEKGFKRAIELNPNYARAHDRYAWLLTMVERHEEAILESKRARELDPLSMDGWVNHGLRYYYARDYDRAIEEYKKAMELFPNADDARRELALTLSHKGLHDEAIAEYAKVEFNPSWHWQLGYIYGMAGIREKALEILDYYLELSEEEFTWPTNIAVIYAGLGEKDKAFEWLEKAYEQHEEWLEFIKVESMFDGLRSDPRFQDLVDRMNFPD